ncbi:MAG: hypothetical protein WD424_07640 [Paenibacillaceae bacterium]
MRKVFFYLLPLCLLAAAGCNNNQDGGMKAQGLQNATVNMADNETVQKAFSEGRIRVMQNNQIAQQEILQNVLHEQSMMLQNPNVFRSSVEIQQSSRIKAVKDPTLQKELLQQNVREQSMTMQDPELKLKVLRQNIHSFHDIAATPELRSQMADAMLLLLKDPKIKQEMEQMIKMALAKETQKIMEQMKMQMKAQTKPIQVQQKSQMQTQPETEIQPQAEQSNPETIGK